MYLAFLLLGFAVWSLPCCMADAMKRIVIPETLPEASKGSYNQLKAIIERENNIQFFFNYDCYSDALQEVKNNCNEMSIEEKYKLAHFMNICFLTYNGQSSYRCTSSMKAVECSVNMNDRAFHSYNLFFTNIHSICLYIANRNFERHTSQLLNKMYEGAGAAYGLLQGFADGLHLQKEQQVHIRQDMTQMREQQSHLTEGLQEGIQRIVSIQGQAEALQEHVNKTLMMEEELARRQGNMAEQISALEQMEQQHAAEASLRWEQMLHRAEQMDERQAHYAALQEALAASSGLLLQQSGQLHGAIQTVLMAQERTSSLLGRVLGGHWTLKDLFFYAAAGGVIILLTGSISLQSARLPLMALLMLTAACERMVRQYFQTWLPLIESIWGITPLSALTGSVDQVGFALRLLSGLTGCVLIMRRLMRIRKLQAEDRRVLVDIQRRMDELAEQQAFITNHILGHNAGALQMALVPANVPAAQQQPCMQQPQQWPSAPAVQVLASPSDSRACQKGLTGQPQSSEDRLVQLSPLGAATPSTIGAVRSNTAEPQEGTYLHHQYKHQYPQYHKPQYQQPQYPESQYQQAQYLESQYQQPQCTQPHYTEQQQPAYPRSNLNVPIVVEGTAAARAAYSSHQTGVMACPMDSPIQRPAAARRSSGRASGGRNGERQSTSTKRRRPSEPEQGDAEPPPRKGRSKARR